MWLFLATEVMFFTGLIGSYIVLRSGKLIDLVHQSLFAHNHVHGRAGNIRSRA